MVENSTTEPGTPLSPSAFSGTTFQYQANDDVELESFDPEAQSLTHESVSVLTRLRNRIPPAWKPGTLNKQRIRRPVEKHPDGFSRFAAWMDCDENFLIARRYGWLHNRVMLFRSSELHELEMELNSVDDELLRAKDYGALKDHESFRHGDAGEVRAKLIQEIDEKLEQYGKLCSHFRFVRGA